MHIFCFVLFLCSRIFRSLWSNVFIYPYSTGLIYSHGESYKCLGACKLTLEPKWDGTRTVECTAWWRHQMEKFSALLAFCAGNSPVTGEFPAQRPVTRSFDVFFYVLLNKRLSKQSWDWWFETPSRPLWRHCNGNGAEWGMLLHGNSWHYYRDTLSCSQVSAIYSNIGHKIHGCPIFKWVVVTYLK